MNKYLITVILLLILDISLCFYLNNLVLSKKTYEYTYKEKPIIYQKQDIRLNDINEFVFENYFEILSFENESYICKFDEENSKLRIKLKNLNLEYEYDYENIEPQIVEKEKVVYETVYVQTENNSNTQHNNDISTYEIIDTDDGHIQYSTGYYCFPVGTDISEIINTISSDIVCYSNVTVDYAYLNPYKVGQYSVYFSSKDEIIEKIVEIA